MTDANRIVEGIERKMNGGSGDGVFLSRALFWPELRLRSRPHYLVKGVLDTRSFAEIFGPTGSGKSFIAIDLGLHVALGHSWRGRRVKQAGVLYVSAEGGAAVINRLLAWSDHHGERLDDVAFAVVLEPTNLLDHSGIAQIVADAATVPDLGLIIIDTVARVMPGSDESAEPMSLLVDACGHIGNATNAAVLVVHHTGKDTSRGSRGSTVLPAAVDAAIEIAREKGSDLGTVTLTKARDGETGQLFGFRLEQVQLGEDGDGDDITSCVVVEADAPPKHRAEKLTDNQSMMFNILDEATPHGLTMREWNDKAKEEGLGTTRAATLHLCRNALIKKDLVYTFGNRWFCRQ